MVTGDASDGYPKVDQGCPCEEDLGRGLGEGFAAAESQGRVPGCAVNGRERCSLEKYYGLYWKIWRGEGGEGV